MKLASLTGPIASCWCSSGLNVVDYRTIMGYPQVVRVRAKVTACGPRTTSARRTMACSSSMVDDPGIEPRDAGNHDAVEILGRWCVGQVAALESLADRHAI